MHLIVREQAGLDEEAVAEDLGLSPADVVVLSFSDSDLTAVASGWRNWAQGKQDGAPPSLRLANLARLRHPMSVDLFLDDTIANSKAVLVRLLGGIDYWRYGVEELARLCRTRNIALALIPGDGRPDPRLATLSTVSADDLTILEALFDTGGQDNAHKAISVMWARAQGNRDTAATPTILPACGVHLDGTGKGMPVLVVFYRSYVLAGDTAPIDCLCKELSLRGLDPTAVFLPSLKAPGADPFVRQTIEDFSPAVIVNATAFSARLDDDAGSPLDAADCPVLQVTLADNPRKRWEEAERGLSATDLAMHVVLPELDGRLSAGAISFKEPDARIEALEFSVTRHTPAEDLIAHTAAQVAAVAELRTKACNARKIALVLSSYPGRADQIAHAVGLDGPESAHRILQALQSSGYAGANLPATARQLLAQLSNKAQYITWPLEDYTKAFNALPETLRNEITRAWGSPEEDSEVVDGAFALPVLACGNLIVALQPERGEPSDRKASYHDPSIPPRHSYVAFYLWLTRQAKIDAMIHLGAHGTLEWLPGKAVALSQACAPRALIGATPVVYPFIVNDPGEAAQAKRRIGAVTIGHMTPPLVASELDNRLSELDRLVNEFASAEGLDARRRRVLAGDIVRAAKAAGLDRDLGLAGDMPDDEAISRIDGFLCDLKEMTIRDGLHIFGSAPENSEGDPELAACGPHEMRALLDALDGRFIQPGPSGAPSRGRRDVLPTGRNLTTIDPRGVPTKTAHAHGQAAAEEILRRYLDDHGDWPRAIVMDVWGSATMRNGGEEIATALHLMGVRPVWDHSSFRVSGTEVLTSAELGRPRVDVTLRVSGLFRDVFPMQLTLYHSAVKVVASLSEDSEINPLAESARQMPGVVPDRIFGASIGTYGAGVSDLIDSGAWSKQSELGEAYLANSATAYRGETDATLARDEFEQQLRDADAFVHVHDHNEADILNSADYAAHEGGPIAAARTVGGKDLKGYHLDTGQPEHPKARTIEEECARIVLGRASSPRWIEGQMRHGFRGAAEMATTVDNAFAYAATTGAVTPAHFDRLYQAYLGDATVAEFLSDANPAARDAMRARFLEAMRRGLWTTRLNSTAALTAEEDE